MILNLDSSGVSEFILNGSQKKNIESYLLNADQVIAPDIFICEIVHVFWKSHRFESLAKKICEELIDACLPLIDEFDSSNNLYREAFQFACEKRICMYDALYMISNQRNSGVLISMDKQLNRIARKEKIEILK